MPRSWTRPARATTATSVAASPCTSAAADASAETARECPRNHRDRRSPKSATASRAASRPSGVYLQRRPRLGIQHRAPEVEAVHPCEPRAASVEQHVDHGRVVGMTLPLPQHGGHRLHAAAPRPQLDVAATATTRIGEGHLVTGQAGGRTLAVPALVGVGQRVGHVGGQAEAPGQPGRHLTVRRQAPRARGRVGHRPAPRRRAGGRAAGPRRRGARSTRADQGRRP